MKFNSEVAAPKWQKEIDILAPIIKIEVKSCYRVKTYFIDEVK